MRFTDKSIEQHELLIQRSEGQFTPLSLSAATTSREIPRRSRGKESKLTTQNTIEENKQIVRAFIETAFNQHQADRAADYLTPDMKWHGGTLVQNHATSSTMERGGSKEQPKRAQTRSPNN